MDFPSPWPCLVNNSGWLTFRYARKLKNSTPASENAWITCLHAKARIADRIIIISQSQLIGFFPIVLPLFPISYLEICFWSSVSCLERSCPLSNIDRNRKETTTTSSSVQFYCSRYDLRFPRNDFFRSAQGLEISF